MYEGEVATAYLWGSEDNSVKQILIFHVYLGSVIKLRYQACTQPFYLLSHDTTASAYAIK